MQGPIGAPGEPGQPVSSVSNFVYDGVIVGNLCALQGTPGPPGENGEPGMKGDPGDPVNYFFNVYVETAIIMVQLWLHYLHCQLCIMKW